MYNHKIILANHPYELGGMGGVRRAEPLLEQQEVGAESRDNSGRIPLSHPHWDGDQGAV